MAVRVRCPVGVNDPGLFFNRPGVSRLLGVARNMRTILGLRCTGPGDKGRIVNGVALAVGRWRPGA
jgi:hypothetical protein